MNFLKNDRKLYFKEASFKSYAKFKNKNKILLKKNFEFSSFKKDSETQLAFLLSCKKNYCLFFRLSEGNILDLTSEISFLFSTKNSDFSYLSGSGIYCNKFVKISSDLKISDFAVYNKLEGSDWILRKIVGDDRTFYVAFDDFNDFQNFLKNYLELFKKNEKFVGMVRLLVLKELDFFVNFKTLEDYKVISLYASNKEFSDFIQDVCCVLNKPLFDFIDSLKDTTTL